MSCPDGFFLYHHSSHNLDIYANDILELSQIEPTECSLDALALCNLLMQCWCDTSQHYPQPDITDITEDCATTAVF